MYKFEKKTVRVSDLRPCPVKVTLQSRTLLANVTEVARKSPGRIEPMTVADLGGVLYIVNGHMRARALREAGVESAGVHMIRVGTISDVVMMHVDLNMHGTINPFGMLDAINFLNKHGVECAVSERYLELGKKMLYHKVRAKLERFLSEVCSKYESVELPLYLVEWLARFETEKSQVHAVELVIDSIRHLRESKFAFPTPLDLDVIFHSLKMEKEEEKEVLVYEPVQEEAGWPKVDRREAQDLVRGSAHDSMFRCKCGKKLLLNSRTHRVSSVDDGAGGCIKLGEEEDASPVYMMPVSMLEFLQAKSAEGVRFIMISSKRDLDRFTSSLKDTSSLRLVVLSK